MAKFVAFEKFSEAIFSVVDKNTLSDGGKTGVNLGAGLLAGFAAAIVSQPADTMLSKINKTQGLPGEGTTTRLIKIAKELGLKGSFSGIGARLFMVSQDPRWMQFAGHMLKSACINMLTVSTDWYHHCRSVRHLR